MMSPLVQDFITAIAPLNDAAQMESPEQWQGYPQTWVLTDLERHEDLGLDGVCLAVNRVMFE
jgi:hypothetical protein